MGRSWIAIVTGAATILVAGDARADFNFEVATGFGGALMRTPTFTMKPLSTSARYFGERAIPLSRTIGMLGAGVDIALTIEDRWRVPLLGGAFWWAVGTYDSAI